MLKNGAPLRWDAVQKQCGGQGTGVGTALSLLQLLGDEGRGVHREARTLSCSGLAQQLEKALENSSLGHKNKQTSEQTWAPWTSGRGACADTGCAVSRARREACMP